MKTPPTIGILGGTKVHALLLGCVVTSTLFIVIPLTQIASDLTDDPQYHTVTVYQAPPPPPPVEPLKKEEEKVNKEEEIQMKKEFQKLNLATIDMALNVGSGGSGKGIYVGSFEIDDNDLNFNLAFEISELDKPPIPVLQIAPTYPPMMKRSHVEGTVVAEFIVTRTGKVIRIDIINSTSREFNDPVINALRRWQFEPGIKDDQKVNTRVRIPFNFRLDQA